MVFGCYAVCGRGVAIFRQPLSLDKDKNKELKGVHGRGDGVIWFLALAPYEEGLALG